MNEMLLNSILERFQHSNIFKIIHNLETCVATVSLSKNKEPGMMTHHWEILICMLKGNKTG